MLIFVGAGLQLLGLVLLFAGFVKTWHSYRDLDDERSFLAFVSEPPRQGIKRGAHEIRERLRGRRKDAARQGSGTISASAAGVYAYGGTATLEVWPSPTKDPEKFAAKVREKFGEVGTMISAQQRALADEQRARRDAEGELRASLDREVRRLDRKAQGAAVGGLRWEFAGWIFLVAGLIVSTIGAS